MSKEVTTLKPRLLATLLVLFMLMATLAAYTQPAHAASLSAKVSRLLADNSTTACKSKTVTAFAMIKLSGYSKSADGSVCQGSKVVIEYKYGNGGTKTITKKAVSSVDDPATELWGDFTQYFKVTRAKKNTTLKVRARIYDAKTKKWSSWSSWKSLTIKKYKK